jgi:hypothetical protein
VLFVAASLAVIVLAWRLPEVYRTRRLKTLIPDALVLNSSRIPSLEKSLAALAPTDTRLSKVMPWGISLVANSEKLSLWTGLGREVLELPWATISRSYAGEAAEATRLSPAICIEVRSSVGSVLLEMVIFGRGPFGAFALRAEQLNPLIEILERFRDDAATANPAA